MNLIFKFLRLSGHLKNSRINSRCESLNDLNLRLTILERRAWFSAIDPELIRVGSSLDPIPNSSLCEILRNLPWLSTTATGTVDFASSDPTILSQLAANADTACKTVLRGMAAVGGLLAHAAPEIEDGTLSPDAVEALGSMLAELGELSGMLVALHDNCRRALPGSAGA